VTRSINVKFTEERLYFVPGQILLWFDCSGQELSVLNLVVIKVMLDGSYNIVNFFVTDFKFRHF